MSFSISRNSDLSSSRRGSFTSTKSRSHQIKTHTSAAVPGTITTENSNDRRSTMTVDEFLGIVCNSNPSSESTLLDAQISLMETPISIPTINDTFAGVESGSSSLKTVDDFWREIVQGERKECKKEALDEMMTLEDFLAKAGAVEEADMKMPPTAFDPIQPNAFQALDNVEGSIVGFGDGVEVIGGGARGRARRGKMRQEVLESMDKTVQRKQHRMIKNRESAAKSRERKQAYQIKLESLALMLGEENNRLLKKK